MLTVVVDGGGGGRGVALELRVAEVSGAGADAAVDGRIVVDVVAAAVRHLAARFAAHRR